MAMFGTPGYGIPGYGGGMFPMDSPFGGPIDFGMDSINQALDQNAAIGAAKPKKGFGEFLKAFAGHLGDNLSGNPVYAQQMQQQAQQQQLEQWYERKRQDEMADYEAKKQIDARYSSPDLPGLADEYNWYNQQPQETQRGVQDYMRMRYPGNFVPPAPVNIPYGATVQGGGGSSPSGLPQVRDEAGYNALPPGATYLDPNGIVRKKGGQSGGGSAGGFPGPY